MIGYHYTSLEQYTRIQKYGLLPYLIDKPDTTIIDEPEATIGLTVHGIWLWPNELRGISHLGSVIFHLMRKGAVNIVKLRVEYNFEDLLQLNGRDLAITHRGQLDNWHYHTYEPAVIVTAPIPADKIVLLKQYDLLQLVGD